MSDSPDPGADSDAASPSLLDSRGPWIYFGSGAVFLVIAAFMITVMDHASMGPAQINSTFVTISGIASMLIANGWTAAIRDRKMQEDREAIRKASQHAASVAVAVSNRADESARLAAMHAEQVRETLKNSTAVVDGKLGDLQGTVDDIHKMTNSGQAELLQRIVSLEERLTKLDPSATNRANVDSARSALDSHNVKQSAVDLANEARMPK